LSLLFIQTSLKNYLLQSQLNHIILSLKNCTQSSTSLNLTHYWSWINFCHWFLSLLLSLKLIILKKRNLSLQNREKSIFLFSVLISASTLSFLSVFFVLTTILFLIFHDYESTILILTKKKNLHFTINHSVLSSSFFSECYSSVLDSDFCKECYNSALNSDFCLKYYSFKLWIHVSSRWWELKAVITECKQSRLYWSIKWSLCFENL